MVGFLFQVALVCMALLASLVCAPQAEARGFRGQRASVVVNNGGGFRGNRAAVVINNGGGFHHGGAQAIVVPQSFGFFSGGAPARVIVGGSCR
jgi:hypothetical protein